MMVYRQNFTKHLVKYLQRTYISFTLKFHNQERCRESYGRQLYPVYRKEDRQDINNWHATSLLSYDNKIYTEILANKIQPTLKDISSSKKSAARTGRIIIENMQLNWEGMSYAKANKIQAATIVLDQEKVFDKGDWNFLIKT